jgi:hypothetical protein
VHYSGAMKDGFSPLRCEKNGFKAIRRGRIVFTGSYGMVNRYPVFRLGV